MAGTYLEGTSKVLSGVYTLIEAAVNRVSIGGRGVVAYPITANWGPVNKLDLVTTQSEFKQKYNAVAPSLTAKLVHDLAFKGQAQRVLPYRMATNLAKKGTASLMDTGSVVAITLETLYPSDRSLIAVVKAGLTKLKVIEITEGGVLLFKAEGDTVSELVDILNTSQYVRVIAQGTNLPENSAGVTFTGGHNGHSVTATEYGNFLTEIEADGTINAFAFPGVTDEAILATAEAFIKRVRTEGMYASFARGGASAWDADLSLGNAKSKAINYRGIINVGNGVDGYTAAEVSTFVAARAASVALNRTLTDEVVPFNDVNVKTAVTPGERIKAKEAGTLIFVKKGDAVLIDEGVNTLTTPPAGEVREMGKIRVNNALDQIAKDLEAFGDEYKKDKSNTDTARETFAATVENTYLKTMASQEVIQDGYFYRPDPEYHGKDAVFNPKIDEAFFHSDITPVDSMERIYQKIGVSF